MCLAIDRHHDRADQVDARDADQVA